MKLGNCGLRYTLYGGFNERSPINFLTPPIIILFQKFRFKRCVMDEWGVKVSSGYYVRERKQVESRHGFLTWSSKRAFLLEPILHRKHF